MHISSQDPFQNTQNHTDPDQFDSLSRLGDNITQMAAHLDAGTYQLLELIGKFDKQGGWHGIGIQALYGETVFPFSVEVITDTEVCIKDIKVFRELVLENSEFSREIIEVLNLISMIGINQRFLRF
jgi:hypothetical protein